MPRGTESILLVEDEKPVRAVIERALRQLGYTVLVAHDGEEAARLADDNHPSLLIADVRLPGIDGPSLAAQIAGNHPDLAVLFVSGYASEAMIENGSLGTEAAFLAKPFTSDDLGRQVRALLDRPRTSKTDLSTSD
jgi:DNA-binding response OmpR family regulator